MKERPIPFTASMVRAILEGRKTQTRRVLRTIPCGCGKRDIKEVQPFDGQGGCIGDGHTGEWWCARCTSYEHRVFCAYGKPGDRLWVRETFCNVALPGYPPVYFYHADGVEKPAHVKHWMPPMFCPRQASRIILEVRDVRVERLNKISEEDAIAEGAKRNDAPGEEWDGSYLTQRYIDGIEGAQNDEPHCSALDWYRHLWQSINGLGSWSVNPWVWVVEFKVIQS